MHWSIDEMQVAFKIFFLFYLMSGVLLYFIYLNYFKLIMIKYSVKNKFKFGYIYFRIILCSVFPILNSYLLFRFIFIDEELSF